MTRPSIRVRLMLGTGIVVAIVLLAANFVIYRAFERMLSAELDKQLLQTSSVLAKSAELEARSLDYEWEEAMKLSNAPAIVGLFQFFDVSTKKVTRSPELGNLELPVFHGALNVPVLRDITLSSGRHFRAVGLLHYPFTDQEAIDEAAKLGKVLKPEDYPQILVCALETDALHHRLSGLRTLLTRAALGTLIAIWVSIYLISSWTLRSIGSFSDGLLERSATENPPPLEIPPKLPVELMGLAGAFNTTLARVEKSREREKEFALHAAHELRTPVAGILATLEQAVRKPRAAEELDHRIRDAITITSGIRFTLDGLMQLARLRGGLEKSNKSNFEPVSVIRAVIASTGGTAAARKLEMKVEVPETPVMLENDPGLFRSVISNLVENAVRYSPEGAVVEFSFMEAGEGFAFESANPCGDLGGEDVERLFEPFQRGRESGGDEGGHAGLGLSLARESARLMGGTLDAVIKEGGVIVFTVWVPA